MTTANTLNAAFASRLDALLKCAIQAIALGHDQGWTSQVHVDPATMSILLSADTWGAPWDPAKCLLAIRANSVGDKRAEALASYLTGVDPSFMQTLCLEMVRADREIGALTDRINRSVDAELVAVKQVKKLQAQIAKLSPETDEDDEDEVSRDLADVVAKPTSWFDTAPIDTAMKNITDDEEEEVEPSTPVIRHMILAAFREYNKQRP